jgi:hypothetical protein
MIVKISKQRSVTSEIDVEIPYYFKHDLGDAVGKEGHDIIYGKIEETQTTTIQEIIERNEKSYAIAVEKYNSIESSGNASYFEAEHKSSEKEFKQALQSAKTFIEEV